MKRGDKSASQGELRRSQAAAKGINIVHPDGTKAPLDIDRIGTIVSEACTGLADVSESAIIDEAYQSLRRRIGKRVQHSLVITARTLIEQEPNYSYAAARLLLDDLRAEGLSFMGGRVGDSGDMDTITLKR